jgi:hypothetical protein
LTSSSFQGQIFNTDKYALSGANIILTHTPTNTQYSIISDSKGHFRFSNIKIGGPYHLKVSFLGYQSFESNNTYLKLGQTERVKVILIEENIEIDEVIISAKRNRKNTFDGDKTSSETVLTNNEIESIPSISGDLLDYIKYSPQATLTPGGGVSIGGINPRYNSIYIDGNINNDVFGLASNGMFGGLAYVPIISDETIEQIQISTSVFDITQSGFAGAAINAVTKSGTNKFKGSVYFKHRCENFIGDTPGALKKSETTPIKDFSSSIYGASIGGPIIKNKLFFFTNIEKLNDETPQPFNINDYSGDSDLNKIKQLRNKLNDYNYSPGNIDNNKTKLGNKFLLKLDWNLTHYHRLTAKTQYTYGENLDLFPSNAQLLNFSNAAGKCLSTTWTHSIELKSRINAIMSNNLKIGYTNAKDIYKYEGDAFPYVSIQDGNGTILFGSNEYYTASSTKQDIFTITNKIDLYLHDHIITIGTHNEYYDLYNQFIPRSFGYYEFGSVDDFIENKQPDRYQITYTTQYDGRTDGATEFRVLQLGFYIQDEYLVTNNFKIIAGLRADIPIYLDNPISVPGFNEKYVSKIEQHYSLDGATSGKTPKTQIHWSPRLSFNWDIEGKKASQLRGGIGVFTSRLPLTWLGASYYNNGLLQTSIEKNKQYENTPLFNPNTNTQYKEQITTPNIDQYLGGTLDLVAEDLKLPQVLKTNIGFDQKLPYGFETSLDFIYTKTISNVIFKDVNIKPSTNKLKGADNRPLFNNYMNGIVPMFDQVILSKNTTKGYSYNFSAELRKDFNFGLKTSFAYAYGKSKTLMDGNDTQNAYEWYNLQVGGHSRNNLKLTTSDFDMGHKVIGSLFYELELLNHLKTTIGLHYNGMSGKPFSYIYKNDGNLTGEAYNGPELIYIPKDASEINLIDNGTISAEQQWKDLNKFINQDEYLKTRRGKYAERNGSRMPFVHKFDLSISQEIFANIGKTKNSLEISFNIFNFGNMLNNDWGVEYYNYANNFELIRFVGFNETTNLPEYTFSYPNKGEAYHVKDSGLISSRWQAMIGIKYKF